MHAVLALATATCAAAAGASPVSQPHVGHAAESPTVHIATDPVRHEVRVCAGPFHVPTADHDHGNGHGHQTPLLTFEWPVDGWLRGFRIRAYTADGEELPRDLLHHLIAYNFDRRQLIHGGVERIFGIGKETRDVVLHRSAGVPLAAGSRLGFDATWHNETGQELHAVYIHMELPFTPPRPNGIAFEGFPFHVDVNYSITGSNEFDIMPGHSLHDFEFVMPTSGALIGVGGHLHEHGRELRLEDVETGRTLFRLRGVHDRSGQLIGVEQKVFRKWFGLRANRLPLEAGRRYRLVAEYENPTDDTIVRGAMAHIAGLFAPHDPESWPSLDADDPDIQQDLARLLRTAPPAHTGHH